MRRFTTVTLIVVTLSLISTSLAQSKKTSFKDNTTDYVVSMEQDGTGATLNLQGPQGKAALITGFSTIFGGIKKNVLSVDGYGNANFVGTVSGFVGNFPGSVTGGFVNSNSDFQVSGQSVLSIQNPTDTNTFVGIDAGGANQSGKGYDNAFNGAGAGVNNTTGFSNTFIGAFAGYDSTVGNNNIFLGDSAGTNNITGSNNVYISSLGNSHCQESNTILIGLDGVKDDCGHNGTYIAGIAKVLVSGNPVLINSNGQLGTSVSSRRFKEQVRDMGDSTNALMRLRPVTFLYKPEYDKGPRTLQYGLIAEEVANVYPELVSYDMDGQPYSVRYQYITTMLLNEVQKQYHRAEAEAKVITAQEEKIEQLEQRLSRIEGLVRAQVQTVAQGRE